MTDTRMFFHVSVFFLCTTFVMSSLHPLAAQDALDPVSPGLTRLLDEDAFFTRRVITDRYPAISIVPFTMEIGIKANLEPAKGEDADCSIRLQTFITELDRTLDSKPASIDPVLRLLKDHFPLEGCDIETALKISGSSRYFSGISESPHVYVVLFDTNKYSKHSGIQVQFGVLKASGSSSLPFAKVKF